MAEVLHPHPVRDRLLRYVAPVAVPVILVAGGLMAARAIQGGNGPERPPNPITSTPNPGETTPETSPSNEPTGPVSPTHPETPKPIEQPKCKDFRLPNGEPAPYGYLTKKDGTLIDTKSVYVCGKIMKIDETTTYEFEDGFEKFTTIRLFLGYDELGKRLYGDFVITPQNSGLKRFVAYLDTKKLPFGVTDSFPPQNLKTAEEIFSEINEGDEIVAEIPVESDLDFSAVSPPCDSTLTCRYNRFTTENQFGYNRGVIDRTPLGNEESKNSSYPVGSIGSLILRRN